MFLQKVASLSASEYEYILLDCTVENIYATEPIGNYNYAVIKREVPGLDLGLQVQLLRRHQHHHRHP